MDSILRQKPDFSAKFRHRDHTQNDKCVRYPYGGYRSLTRPIITFLHVEYTVVTFYYFLSITFSSWYSLCLLKTHLIGQLAIIP